MMKYLNVIVDSNTNSTDELYTYACDIEGAAVGSRVKVSFGTRKRLIDAYVAQVLEEPPEGIPAGKIKKIAELDKDFSLSEEAMSTALWMHRRYLCRYIEAVNCFLPSFNSRNGRSRDPFEDIEQRPEEAKELTEAQRKAAAEIGAAVESGEHSIFLLHGVTGSGKTEVYLQAMEKTLKEGRQGIVLVPEISLTPQTVQRFVDRFGKDIIAVLHSRLTPAQKDAEYKRIMTGEAGLVIGARSAIFAPLRDIGLIVIDEEHETSYKSDKSPKYDAIELAVRRAQTQKAVLILGSATPSVQDYYRSSQGIFRRIELPARYNENPLPRVEIADMTLEVKAGNRSPFSKALVEEMDRCLKEKKQVILFLNRRGYSNHVSCRECGYVVTCPECGIAMPYHKDIGRCVCHYCGRSVPLPKVCPDCGSKIIGMYGVGTQQVEEKAKELFPEARTERVDLDTVSKKGALEAILRRFEKKKTDILIGTQLVAKGLDFDNVGLVGVISADTSLNIPDFRSGERSFQLMTQAAGRSGRGSEQGLVIIQTYDPENAVIRAASRHDYLEFYGHELEIRRAVSYPPFSYIFQIISADPDAEKAEAAALRWAEQLRSSFGGSCAVLGPAATTRLKLGGMYRFQILVKAPAGLRQAAAEKIGELKKEFIKGEGAPELISIDINPYSFM
jgi:primosomal protein N' (replication factor Y)